MRISKALGGENASNATLPKQTGLLLSSNSWVTRQFVFLMLLKHSISARSDLKAKPYD